MLWGDSLQQGPGCEGVGIAWRGTGQDGSAAIDPESQYPRLTRGYGPFACRKEVLLRDAGQPGNWQWPDGATEPVVGEDGR